MTDSRVEVDTAALAKGLETLLRSVDGGVEQASYNAAHTVSMELIAAVPVETGALMRSIAVTKIHNGAEVHYGGNLRYGWPVNARTGVVDDAQDGAEDLWVKAATEVAEAGVRRI